MAALMVQKRVGLMAIAKARMKAQWMERLKAD